MKLWHLISQLDYLLVLNNDYYNRFTACTQRNLNEATALFCIGKPPTRFFSIQKLKMRRATIPELKPLLSILLQIALQQPEYKEKLKSAYTKAKGTEAGFGNMMSDNQIEKTYKVPGYPTKLLVTPAGKYILVPFGSDWISFVKHYADL